jgi:hypothetical protein
MSSNWRTLHLLLWREEHPSYSGPVTCDKKANAAFLFDVNTLTWTDEFTPNEGTYEIPSQVIELIGGK